MGYDGFERFETRPELVKCKRVWVDTPVDTPYGRKMAFAGWWICVRKGGAAVIMPDDLFREFCKPVTTAAEAIWKENPGKGLHPVEPFAWNEEPEAS